MALGDALTNAGRWGEAAELRLALAADVEPIRASQLRTIAAEQFLCSGRFDRGEAVLEGVLRDARVYVPRSPLTTLLALVAARIVLWLRGLRYTLQKKPLPQDVAIRIDSLISAGYGLGMTDEARGAYFSTRALIQSLGAGDPERLVRTLASEVGYSSAEGQKASKSASALLDRLRTLTLAVDTPFARAMLAAMTGWYQYFVVQDFAAAREGFLQAQRMLSEFYAVPFWVRTTVRTMLFRAMVQLGDRNELAERVAATYREMDETRDLHGLVNLWTGPLAWQRLVDDRPEVADAELEKATLHLPKGRFLVQTYFHLLATVQLCLYRGQVEPAFQKMEQSWKPLRWSLLLRVGVIRVQALETRGRAALAAAAAVTGEERERRLRRVEDVVLRLPREGTAWAKGYAELLRAGAEALRSHGPEANRLAQEAERTFAGASMKLHVAASQWVQGVCVGGEEGAALVEVARRAMAAAGVGDRSGSRRCSRRPWALRRATRPEILARRAAAPHRIRCSRRSCGSYRPGGRSCSRRRPARARRRACLARSWAGSRATARSWCSSRGGWRRGWPRGAWPTSAASGSETSSATRCASRTCRARGRASAS